MSFTNVKAKLAAIDAPWVELQTAVDAIDTIGEMDDELNAIHNALLAILTWAEQGEQNALVNSFLTSLKAVFVEYNTTLSVVETLPPYGTEYGGDAESLKFVISKDGVNAEKVFNKNSITSVDM